MNFVLRYVCSLRSLFGASTRRRKNETRHLSLFVILIIWIELGGELGVQSSGHSKWKTIRHTKTTNDQKRSSLFSKLMIDIGKAALTGSVDPKMNHELGKAVAAAQKANMPAATIKRALDRIAFRKKNPKPTFFAFKGPNGVYVLVNTLTDDQIRTKVDLNRIRKKHRYAQVLSDPTSPFFVQGWIFAKPSNNVTNVAEQGLEDAIEVGADEVEPDEENPENLKFICESTELRKVKAKLEGRNYTVEDAYDMYLPRMPIEIPEDEMHSVNALLEEIEDLPEVEKVFTNIA